MPDIAAADDQRGHIALILDGLAEGDELVPGLGDLETIVGKVLLVVHDAHGVGTGHGRGVSDTVKLNRGGEQRLNIIAQGGNLAGADIHGGVAHLHHIGELTDAVLGFQELAVGAAVARLDRDGDVGVGSVKVVNDLVHLGLKVIVAIGKDKAQLSGGRNDAFRSGLGGGGGRGALGRSGALRGRGCGGAAAGQHNGGHAGGHSSRQCFFHGVFSFSSFGLFHRGRCPFRCLYCTGWQAVKTGGFFRAKWVFLTCSAKIPTRQKPV